METITRAEIRQFFRLPGSVGGTKVELPFAVGVAPVGDRRTVGRPGGKAIPGARAPREIPDRSVLGGDGQEFTPRLENRPLAGRGNVAVLDRITDCDRPRSQGHLVGDDLDRDFRAVAGREIHQIQRAPGFEHNVLRSDRRKVNVEILEVRHLPGLAGRRVDRPDIGPHLRAAVREEIDRIAVPHRQRVIGRILRQIPRLQRFEIEEPDLRGQTAPVPFPRPEFPARRLVGQRLAVGRQGAELTVGYGQAGWKSALRIDGPQLVDPSRRRSHRSCEEEPLSVGRPSEKTVGRRVMGDTMCRPTIGGDGVDVDVAVVVAGKGDGRPVRGKPGKTLLPGRRRQTPGDAAGLLDDPDIAGIDEGDFGVRHVGKPQHPRIDRGADSRRDPHQHHTQRNNDRTHDEPPDRTASLYGKSHREFRFR